MAQQLMKRVLVVDDELDSNLALKLVLEDNGFKVDAFTDPLLALENFKAGLIPLYLQTSLLFQRILKVQIKFE